MLAWLSPVDASSLVFQPFDRSAANTSNRTAASHCAGLWLQWRGFGPGTHVARPEPGGPLAHYDECMPLEWPPRHLKRLQEQGLPPDGGQAAAIVKYGKSVVNTYWVAQASNAHGFMYRCALYAGRLELGPSLQFA